MGRTLFAAKLFGTTAADGTLTIVHEFSSPAWLEAVEWIVGDFAAGVDATLKIVDSESAVDKTILTLTDANANAWYYPRELEDDNAGAALTTYTRPIINGDLQLAVTSGGNALAGGCIVYYFQ